MRYVKIEQREKTAVITLNRPDRLNAISNALLADLQEALDHVEQLQDIHAVVLSGAGRAFCAGEDLKEIDNISLSEESISQHITAIQSITRTMRTSSKIYICAAHGYAVGGGFEWMIGCDLVVAADDLIAFFPEMDRALFPTGGVSWLLPLAVGYHRAMELILLGERQTAQRLQQLGLVNWVVPTDKLLAKAIEISALIAAKPTSSMAQFKKLLNQDLSPLFQALELEQRYTVESFSRAAEQQGTRGRFPSGI